MDKSKPDSKTHRRRSLRLPQYDYAQPGGYFITICTHDRVCLFGDNINGAMMLNDAGIMVEKYWNEIPQHFTHVTLDEHAVMPNHFHGIIFIVGAGSSRPVQPGSSRPVQPGSSRPVQPGSSRLMLLDKCEDCGKEGREDRAPTVGNIVAYFKYQSTKHINVMRNGGFQKLWQRNYYERVIRNEKELFETRQYIINNPMNWELDENYRRGGVIPP
jgi:REP element-mobilizing transposase RayT